MIHLQRTMTINASSEAVWHVLARFMHIDEFAPKIRSVDALTEWHSGIGARRRCVFEDGNSVVEEVTEWQDNRMYRVRLSEIEPLPLMEAFAELSIQPKGASQTKVVWSVDYKMKFGPLGWLMGQTVMRMATSKIVDGNLKGLEEQAKSLQAA